MLGNKSNARSKLEIITTYTNVQSVSNKYSDYLATYWPRISIDLIPSPAKDLNLIEKKQKVEWLT